MEAIENKVLRVISSCRTRQHLNVAFNMILNYTAMYGISREMIIFYTAIKNVTE